MSTESCSTSSQPSANPMSSQDVIERQYIHTRKSHNDDSPIIETNSSIGSDTTVEKIKNRQQEQESDQQQQNKNDKSLMRLTWYLAVEFVPKLVLEVWGGAGAIWGFSEAVTLRRPETLWFWRPASLVVGFLFLLRFVYQIKLAVDIFYYGTSNIMPLAKSHSFDLEVGESNLALQLRLARSMSSTDSTSTHMDGNVETVLNGNKNIRQPTFQRPSRGINTQ